MYFYDFLNKYMYKKKTADVLALFIKILLNY